MQIAVTVCMYYMFMILHAFFSFASDQRMCSCYFKKKLAGFLPEAAAGVFTCIQMNTQDFEKKILYTYISTSISHWARGPLVRRPQVKAQQPHVRDSSLHLRDGFVPRSIDRHAARERRQTLASRATAVRGEALIAATAGGRAEQRQTGDPVQRSKDCPIVAWPGAQKPDEEEERCLQ